MSVVRGERNVLAVIQDRPAGFDEGIVIGGVKEAVGHAIRGLTVGFDDRRWGHEFGFGHARDGDTKRIAIGDTAAELPTGQRTKPWEIARGRTDRFRSGGGRLQGCLLYTSRCV